MADSKSSARSQADTDAVAPPIEKAADWAGDFEYRDMPDSEKPAPSTVAQEQVLPSDK